MDEHWKGLGKTAPTLVDDTALRSLRSKNDLNMNFTHLDAFLCEVKARQGNAVSSTFKPTSELPTFAASQLPQKLHESGVYGYYRLVAFEAWVEHHLQCGSVLVFGTPLPAANSAA
jgi:hypothetical protein